MMTTYWARALDWFRAPPIAIKRAYFAGWIGGTFLLFLISWVRGSC